MDDLGAEVRVQDDGRARPHPDAGLVHLEGVRPGGPVEERAAGRAFLDGAPGTYAFEVDQASVGVGPRSPVVLYADFGA